MDGFRWDYLENIDTPNFDSFAAQGVKVRYMNNTFIPETFPCHFTMVTGLYEESHGIVGNYMYDPIFNESFGLSTHDSKWWEAGEPIWITATKKNKKSATHFWPGSEVEFNGVRPAIWLQYNETIPFEKRIETVVDWFANKGVHFATLYFHEPDRTGHKYGPDSQEIKDKVKYMDGLLGSLILGLRENKLWDSINVIITSDHGMASVDVDNKLVDINDYVPANTVKMVPRDGAVIQILPEDGQEDVVFQALKAKENEMHATVYKKDDIPERYHYKNNRRVAPIVAIAEEGWLISDKPKKYSKLHSLGGHGYDNRFMSMKPIFLAHGPNFKVNYKQESIESVDIYPLICKLLGVNAAPNNGSLSNTAAMLKANE
ncbi:hypothetical protein SNE40_010840 [Patella caerulea]